MDDESASRSQSWFAALEGTRQKQADGLARIVNEVEPRLDEAVKWGRLTFTARGDWHHWICAIAASKAGARLVFHKGALLHDPDGLLSGRARYVREVRAEVALQHPDAVHALIRNAITHQADVLDQSE